MIRKLSLAVAVATALSPMGAWALGLGDIHSRSALNQKFSAEIDLLSVDQEEIQDLRVGLASQEAFDRAGIERFYLLSGLKFTPMMTPAGKPVVMVTSTDPIREPFLNFLLEVNWPKGRLVREYTVLLDPPVTLNRAPQAVSAPTTGMSSRQVTRAPTRPSTSVSAPASPMGGREYGPVQPNDNLWTIAKMLRAEGESVEQVMMALQRYNADAFINQNVNNLKVGKVLRLPDDADVTSLSKRQAREEFLAQTAAWRSGRSTGTSTAVVPSKSSTRKSGDRLKLISSKLEGGEAMSREGKAEADAEVTRLEQEILLVRESNDSALQENESLRNRVSELEKQIEDIQRLVTLKSDEAARMQAAQQMAAEKMEEAVAPVPPVEVVETPAEPATMAPAEEAAVTTPPTTEGAVVEETPPEQATPQQEAVAPVAPPPVVTPEQPVVAEQPAVVEAPVEPTTVETPPVRIPAKKVGYFDSLRENSTLVGIVGAVAVVLIGMLWLIMRRRKEAEAEFAESILVSPDSEVVSAGKDDVDSLNEPSDETSFMSDFSPSDIDALQDETGEVDPLSEADVYIAYGRYQQAEELIKQAIEKFPDREELKHKLLEIYFSSKKSKEYTKLAEDLHEGGLENRDQDVWSKIASMGKDLNPSHALFAGAAGAAGASLLGDEDLDDLGLDLGPEFAGTSASPDEHLSSDEIDSMDLSGLDSLDEMDSESLEADLSLDSEYLDKMASGDSADGEGLDIDLSDLDADSAISVQADDAPLNLDDADNLEAPEDAIELEDSESLDHLDLESIERELENLSEDLDVTDDSLELPEANSEDISLDLDSTDEVTTKLDLARAYIDMGDSEGAKSILEEVISEGSDQQQEEASELMKTISI
jgi:pilus assembly protein FimV